MQILRKHGGNCEQFTEKVTKIWRKFLRHPRRIIILRKFIKKLGKSKHFFNIFRKFRKKLSVVNLKEM